MSWAEQKRVLNEQKTALDSNTTDAKIEQLVTSMNAAIARYTNAAGISSNPSQNSDYADANAKFSDLVSLQKQYAELNKSLSRAVRGLSDNADLQNKLQVLGRLKQDIVNLEQSIETEKKDVDVAATRQATVEKPREQLSWYQGFGGLIGFNKPIHKFSIPFLIGFGLLLLFFSGLMLRDLFIPSSGMVNTQSSEGLFSFFTDARFYSAMAGVVFVSAVLTVLAYRGNLGTSVR